MTIDQHWPSITIVLLTWNQKTLTLDCLQSLAKVDYPTEQLHIIVVDNGSTDNTAKAIRQAFRGVTVLENSDNLGFAAGNNVGIKCALELHPDYVMLLNNDTLVAPDFLSHLLPVAASDPKIGIVTPKIYYYDPPDRIWCAGADVCWVNGVTRRLHADETDDGGLEANTDVTFASGCALCVRRSVIEEVGMLDPRFFIYYEETDWCLRMTRAGYRCVYVPQSKIWHRVSSAMQEGSPRSAYYMSRNVLLFLQKSLPLHRRLVAIPVALIRELTFILVMSIRPRHRHRRVERNARLYGIRDFLRGRFGKMPESYVSPT
jgi:GT2 family glycosyltransferase